MHEAAGDAGDEEVVVDLEFHGVAEGLRFGGEHFVEFGGLGDCAGETVEDEAGIRSVGENAARVGELLGL